MSDEKEQPEVWSSVLDDSNILPAPDQELPNGVELTVVDDSPVEDDENTGSVLQDALEDQAAYTERKADEHDANEVGIERELQSLLNRYSAESVSGTPDYILAHFLIEVLKLYNEAVSRRAEWRGEFVDFDPSRNVHYTNEFTGERIQSPGDVQQEILRRGGTPPKI